MCLSNDVWGCNPKDTKTEQWLSRTVLVWNLDNYSRILSKYPLANAVWFLFWLPYLLRFLLVYDVKVWKKVCI